MKPSLADPLLKLERAKEHMEEIEREVARFFEGDPYDLIEECDLKDGSHVFRLKVCAEIPSRIGLIVGDCLNNLRSSLDHLAWQLALLTTATPRDRTAFLVCETEASWKRHKSNVGDLPKPARDIMNGLQPYKTPEPRHDWLYRLNRLWNDDKHRTIPLFTQAVAGGYWNVQSVTKTDLRFRGSPVAPLPEENLATIRNYRVLCEDGAVIARCIPDVPYTEMHIEPDPRFAVAFGPEVPLSGGVPGELYAFHDLIRNTVFDVFAGFF